MIKNFLILCFLLTSFSTYAQDDLLSKADSLIGDNPPQKYVQATFDGTRIINGHSIETPAHKDLHFLISHRFGTINKGIYEFFGLDQATIRLGLEYGITDQLTVGYGRSSLEKTYDVFLKYKLLRQQEEVGKMPVSVTLFSSAAITSMRFNEDEPDRNFASRLSYAYQVMIARKFSKRLSLQLSPTMIHRNYVETIEDQNNVYAAGLGGRFKLSKRVAITGEYYYLLPGKTADDYKNSFSLGLDIETGGHVFQLHFTNSQGMIEKFFIPQTTSSWDKGEIYFGFNVSRVFTLGEKKKKW